MPFTLQQLLRLKQGDRIIYNSPDVSHSGLFFEGNVIFVTPDPHYLLLHHPRSSVQWSMFPLDNRDQIVGLIKENEGLVEWEDPKREDLRFVTGDLVGVEGNVLVSPMFRGDKFFERPVSQYAGAPVMMVFIHNGTKDRLVWLPGEKKPIKT